MNKSQTLLEMVEQITYSPDPHVAQSGAGALAAGAIVAGGLTHAAIAKRRSTLKKAGVIGKDSLKSKKKETIKKAKAEFKTGKKVALAAHKASKRK